MKSGGWDPNYPPLKLLFEVSAQTYGCLFPGGGGGLWVGVQGLLAKGLGGMRGQMGFLMVVNHKKWGFGP